MSATDPAAQRWIVSAVPADGSAFPYNRVVTATGGRSAIREAAGTQLQGISADFSADEIEALVRTAAEAVCGSLDDLSGWQVTLARQARTLMDQEMTPAGGWPDDITCASADQN